MRWTNDITPLRIRSGCYDNTGKNIFTVTYAEAYAVVIAAWGTPYSIINEIDKGKQKTIGYYWHCHVNRLNKSHIWYLF